jgi:Phospholipase_D-nuclease N-terminal
MNILAFGLASMELLIIGFALLAVPFWIWMLVDCATNEEDQNQKIVWVIIIAVVGLIGAPLYFFVRKLPRKARAEQSRTSRYSQRG